MAAIEIASGLYWIGVQDPELTLFDELYPTSYGTSYNAYLVQGKERCAIIDTVKGKRHDEFLANLRDIIDPARVDYIVVNHSEPDHSGSLPYLLPHCPNATVLSTQAARTFLGNQIHTPFASKVVKDGESVDLGGRTLTFINAPFLHWPDTMFTWVKEDGALFPCDAFGAHFSSTSIFADETPDFTSEIRFYFDSLMRPFKEKIRAALAKVEGLDVRLLCPSHGPVSRIDAARPIELYRRWAEPKPRLGKRIAIFYLSPHGNTEAMAEAVFRGASVPGVTPTLCRITQTSQKEIRDLLEENDALIFGVPTINRDVPRPMWEVLADLSAVSLKADVAGVFGSYGWSGEACRMAEDRLKAMGLKIPVPYLRFPFKPKDDGLGECEALGRAVAEEILKKDARQ